MKHLQIICSFSRGILISMRMVAFLGLVLAQSSEATTYFDTGSMINRDGRMKHTATLLPNGKILVVGGEYYQGGHTYASHSSAELYDPISGAWAETGSLETSRFGHSAILLPHGKVLVGGGMQWTGAYGDWNNNKTNPVTTNELYDPISGTWSIADPMILARDWSASVLMPNGMVLVTGANGAEIYDPNSDSYTPTDPDSSTRYWQKATLLTNGNVLVTGGINGPAIYDPLTGNWTQTNPMESAVGEAYLLPNGKVYLSGGALYDPVTGIWLPASQGYGMLLPNGNLLAIGGNLVNCFDPLTGALTTGVFNIGESYPDSTHTVLNNGDVLIAGGKVMATYASRSAKIYRYLSSLTIESSNQGIITGNASPYLPNATAVLSANPNPGYLFDEWRIWPIAGGWPNTTKVNPVFILMDVDQGVSAFYIPDTKDDDGDGLTNFQEIVNLGTNPNLPDTDGDDVEDGDDAFPLNSAETLDTDRDGTGDNADTDDDGDGLSDEDEANIHNTNPKRADSDGDGLSDPAELQTHLTNPNLADSDDDGLSDGAEINTHGTNPKLGDTDGDGFLDGYEFYTGKSPLDDQDKPALVAEARTAIEFTFSSALGITYRIEDSLDLSTWTTVESRIPGNGQLIQRFYSTRNIPKRYFRVEKDGP